MSRRICRFIIAKRYVDLSLQKDDLINEKLFKFRSREWQVGNASVSVIVILDVEDLSEGWFML